MEPEKLQNLTGLVNKDEAENDPDYVRQEDLAIARNMRRIEIHRYQIASALENVSEVDIGTVTHVEDEIALPEGIIPPRAHPTKRTPKRSRFNADELIDEHLETWSLTTKRAINWLSNKVNLKSWHFLRQNFAILIHQSRYDREMEDRLFNPLTKFTALANAKTLKERANVAPCAPVRLIDWSLDIIAAYQEGGSLRNFIYIDPEAGHARTMLLASHRDFHTILGFETRREYFEDAQMNIAQYPRTFMAQRRIELYANDFRDVEWPEHPLVIHLFKPHSASWLERFMRSLATSYNHLPRQIYLVTIDNQFKGMVTNSGLMHQFMPPCSHVEKISLMSPYDVEFYCTHLA